MKSKRIIPVFFILILSLFPTPPFVEGAGYGEENENLGQFTDDFENDDNVSVAVDVINNQTLDCMELNYTTGGIGYVNFTSYTEVDVDGDITKNVFDIEWDTMRRDADSYVYLDWGVGYWDDFEYDFELNITDLEAGDITSATVTGFCILANDINSIDNLRTGNKPNLGMQLAQNLDNDDEYFMYIWEDDLVGNVVFVLRLQNGGDYVFSANTKYYFRFNRSGFDVGGYAYSDSARTVLLASREATSDGNNFRYLYPLNNWGRDVDGADHHTGYLENLNVGGSPTSGYVTDGYFTTEDYLNYTTGQGLALLTNASIPYGTSMTVQFSNDNVTWVDNEGNMGSTTVLDGFYAIDLRDLNYTDSFKMYNLTTTNTAITPRLFQSRLVTTNGTAGGGPGTTVTVESFFWIPIAIVLSIIVGLLVWLKYEHN